MTIKQFCKKHHISVSTLYKWKNTIQGHKKIGVFKKKTSSNELTSNFIEVPFKKQNHSSPGNITIIFPNGVKVIFSQEIEPSRLIQILKANEKRLNINSRSIELQNDKIRDRILRGFNEKN